MSRLSELLQQVETADPQLADDLRREVKALNDRRPFGLNFERHIPEIVDLHGRPVRRGDKVRFLPESGKDKKGLDRRIWKVKGFRGKGTNRTAALARPGPDREAETAERAVEDLVVVAEFRDSIYPGLVSTGKVERGGDKPFHTVINAENFHALQALLYTHEGKIDAIYIDPPYNTRDKDWKYNNDYVDSDDAYRHSKWLAMMERRLKLATRLLNPQDSVLIVTIDENEVHRLGLLLEQVLRDSRITMISSSINSAGATRRGTFARAAEYVYFAQFGASRPIPLVLGEEWNPVETENKNDIYWSRLIRSGSDAQREDSPNQFFPVFIREGPDGPEFAGIGDPYHGSDRRTVAVPEGATAVWPIRQDGTEGRWRTSNDLLRELVETGHARLGRWRGERTTVYYLKEGERTKVTDGVFAVVGHRPDGSVVTENTNYSARFVPTDIWRITSHDAGNSGSRLLRRLIPGRSFPYPKSLYAVEDALRFFVGDKPNATILDFFAGSGTTAHAVMRLNRQHGGQRQCMSVTNNEVSADEQGNLQVRGLRPGDADWEALGIYDYITKPRITAAITGETPDGNPVQGEYKFTDEFPMADGFQENAEFFTMTYEAPLSVAHHRSFAMIAPLLWLRAGAEGSRIEDAADDFAIADTYAVLFDLDSSGEFLTALQEARALRIAYIVTDDDRAFQAVCGELPMEIEAVRLYSSYLTNFQINAPRE